MPLGAVRCPVAIDVFLAEQFDGGDGTEGPQRARGASDGRNDYGESRKLVRSVPKSGFQISLSRSTALETKVDQVGVP